jgi:hypothetical protein
VKVSSLTLVLLFTLSITAMAHAERRCFLVGLRHVYDIPAWPDPSSAQRARIEERYAQAVGMAQSEYDQAMTDVAGAEADDKGSVHQADRDSAQFHCESSIEAAAENRDAALGQLYPVDDQILTQYPDLAVDADGPYQVLALDLRSGAGVYDVTFLQPYADFPGPPPFGWTYGTPYSWFQYTTVVTSWRKRWRTHGRPPFIGLYSAGRLVELHMSVRLEAIADRRHWVSGIPPRFDDASRAAFSNDLVLRAQSGAPREPAYAELARQEAARRSALASRAALPAGAPALSRERMASPPAGAHRVVPHSSPLRRTAGRAAQHRAAQVGRRGYEGRNMGAGSGQSQFSAPRSSFRPRPRSRHH